MLKAKNGIVHKAAYGDGRTYTGEVKGAFRHGYGVLEGLGFETKGYWKENILHGWCSTKMPDGYVFTGQFINGERHGKGSEYFPNGRTIKGTWKSDIFQPDCKIEQPDGSVASLKIGKNFAVIGSVVIKYIDGSVYKGGAVFENIGTDNWNLVRHGYGVLRLSDKTEIEGYWIQDERMEELVVDCQLIS